MIKLISRPLLQGKKLRVYVDSESFLNLLDNGDSDAKKLLNWFDIYTQYTSDSRNFPKEVWTKYIEFLRSPFDSKYNKLNNLKSYEFKPNEDFNHEELYFHYGPMPLSHETTEFKCKHILSHVKPDILKKITSLMVNFYEFCIREDEETRLSNNYMLNLIGCLSENTNILLTNNKYLLKNRIRLEKSLIDSNFFGEHPLITNYPLNIVTLKDANEIIDLFLKYRNLYYFGITKFDDQVEFTDKFNSEKTKINATIEYPTDFDEFNWYLTSFRTKVPYFQAQNDISMAFGNRFMFLLMCIDKIGKLYYLGANNNTQMGMLYNFNYLISLITGILDNLAIMTNEKYEICEDYEKEKVTLNPNKNSFLNSLKNKNKILYGHIQDYIYFLKLIHELRNPLIHREMFNNAFLINRIDKYIKHNILVIDKEILQSIHNDPKRIKDKAKRLKWWGIHISKSKDSEEYLVEPFHFSKSVTTKLIEFSNYYLNILGNTNFIEEYEDNYKDSFDVYHQMMNDFNKVNLGF